MKSRSRYINIWQELSHEKSMIFVAGPRQSGKTTLAQMIMDKYVNNLYFNWDIPRDRRVLIETPFFFEEIERKDGSSPLIVFDEIHKYRDWKNYLKGVYDQFNKEFTFLVSGSGRLDMYQKGGDSLAGRYYLFHLWPFTLSELSGANRSIDKLISSPLDIFPNESTGMEDLWVSLGRFSGFPEPFLAGKDNLYRRWSTTYSNQLLREDIRDLTNIRTISDLETLYYLLPSKVGSPLSIPSLSTDLKLAYNTIRSWLDVFERFFLLFSLTPWTRRISRAIQKERKIYIWDTPRIENPAARFENMVALELYRATTIWNDMGWGRFGLHFIKNKEQQEVDFLITNDNKPWLLIETKLSDNQPSPALLKFQTSLQIPAIQLINKSGGYRLQSNNGQKVLIAPAWHWLASLP